MATAVVFVDEAVEGGLPPVCARTGDPSDMVLRMDVPVGGMNPLAWLLVLVGPPGWLALAVIVALSGRETLTVRLPYTRAAWDRSVRRRRARLLALAGVVVGAVLAFWMAPALRSVGLVVAGASIVAALALHALERWDEVGVALDASRRWVTLSAVHPAFADAVAATPRAAAPR
jgi:hypothetical protein